MCFFFLHLFPRRSIGLYILILGVRISGATGFGRVMCAGLELGCGTEGWGSARFATVSVKNEILTILSFIKSIDDHFTFLY